MQDSSYVPGPHIMGVSYPEWDLGPKGRTVCPYLRYSNWAMAKWLISTLTVEYAFASAYVHRVIYHERGLLTAQGKTIKNKQEI